MNPTNLDTIATFFATRRQSRRQALRQAGTRFAAAGLALTGISSRRDGVAAYSAIAAAGATPVANASAKPVETLFVQSYETGSLTPQAGKTGMYTLTLEQGLGDTIYFTSRPERHVGAMQTSQFLKTFPFGEENPPNAALIGHVSPTHENISVIELINPRYDTSTNTATYDAKVLQDMHEVDLHFEQTPNQEVQSTRNFTAAHLFIDDCPDSLFVCLTPGELGDYFSHYKIHNGTCWSWDAGGRCSPCRDYGPECNAAFPDHCQGQCHSAQCGFDRNGIPTCKND